MGMFWNANMSQSANFTGNPASNDRGQQLRELEHQVARLQLMNQALWELLRDRVKLTDTDLREKAQEIDLRDGVQDGEITNTALKCPSCGRVSSSKHWKCLYCGLEFEKPIMG